MWSSRTAIEFALLSIINHKTAWALFNAFFISLTLCSLSYSIARTRKEIVVSSCIFLLIILFTIKKGFIKDGIFWMTGSVNYLWPLSLSFAGFSLIKSCFLIRHPVICYLAIPVVFFFSSFSEQLVVVNLILLTTIALIYEGDVRRVALLSLIATLVVFIYIILCPGNIVRFSSEITRWNPDFIHLSTLEKLILGVNLSFDQMFSVQPIALLIIFLSLSLLADNRKIKILALLMSLASIILLIFQRKTFSIMDFDTIFRFNSSNA